MNARFFLFVSGSLLFSCCSSLPLEFNNLEADKNERLERDPELAWYLDSLKIPQDDRLHYSGGISRLHDRGTGAPIGWSVTASVKCAWPRDMRAGWARNASRRVVKAAISAQDLPAR